MRQAAIVAGWLHAVMGAQRLVVAGLVLPGIGVEIAEGGRQAVAAMRQRRPTKRPPRVLQALGRSDEALAVKHEMGVLPTGEGQPEMVEPVIERHVSDADAVTTQVGKIGQPEPARRVFLPEDDLLLGALERPPGADAPLQVRRMPAPISGWRRRISSKIATDRKPGVLFSGGTTSRSQTSPSGSGRRRHVELEQLTDIIGRNFSRPKEGLGFDNSPVAHMWRAMIRPAKYL